MERQKCDSEPANSRSQDRRFIVKVKSGNVKAVKDYIKVHGLPERIGMYTDYELLQTALSEGYIEIAKLLVSAGCRISTESEHPNDMTPLCWAVVNNNVELAKMILDRNVHPHIKTAYKCCFTTVLHVAIKRQVLPMLRLILTYNINVDEPNDFGQTALQYLLLMYNYSIRNSKSKIDKFLKMLRLLLSNGANVGKKDSTNNKTPLHLAVETRQDRLFEILLPFASNVDVQDDDGNTPLHSYFQRILSHDTTSYDTNLTIVKSLLNKGATVTIKNTQGVTPVHLAMKLKNSDIANKILEHTSDVNICDQKRSSPLHFLADIESRNIMNSNEVLEIAKMILAKNANIHLCDQNGHTPLHIAVWRRQSDLVQYLLDQGANVNAVNRHGDSVLHLFIKTILYKDMCYDTVDLNIINILVVAGANLMMVNRLNKTVLHMVAEGARLESKNKTNQSFAVERKLRIMLVFLKYCDRKVIMLTDKEGNTALHIMLTSITCTEEETKLYVEITRQLLSKTGLRIVNKKNNEGDTPLHLAAENNHYMVMEVLLLNGANTLLFNSNGYTVLHVLLDFSDKFNINARRENYPREFMLSVEKLLENMGSVINVPDIHGMTPLRIAIVSAYPNEIKLQLVRLLLKYGADPNAINLRKTALYTACEREDEISSELVQELIRYGANINVFKNNKGHTLLSILNSKAVSNCIKDILINHALKLRIANLPLVKANSLVLDEVPVNDSNLYVAEIFEMNNYRINEQITVADLLRMPVNRIMTYINNLEFRQLIFESDEFVLKFPHYLDIIRTNCRKALIRRNLICSAKVALNGLCRFVWPDICSENILKTLSDDSLRRLIDANKLNNYNIFCEEFNENDVRQAKRMKLNLDQLF